MRKKKQKAIRMVEVEADFAGVIYRIGQMPHARRVLDLLTHKPTRGTRMELNAIVGRYRFSAVIGSDGLVYIPAPGTDREECTAVMLLLSLDPGRIKRCQWCREWFYAASRLDQLFCKNGNCRQNAHQSDPATYEDKKEKMRKLYRLKSDLAKNPNSGIGLR